MQVPLPQYNIEYLVSARPAVLGLDPTTSTISVDVLSVSGNSAVIISKDANVFYETETLAIVRRYKSKTSGLVGTTLWAWRGRQADLGVREQQKLTELAKRYGTSVVGDSLIELPPHSLSFFTPGRSMSHRVQSQMTSSCLWIRHSQFVRFIEQSHIT
jgi:hypothetical protein